jgi:Holliday junction resolvasome RuvABC endonuclease subunit
MKIAGIDYSLTSPAICIHEGNIWDYNKCKFYYLTSKKKWLVNSEQFYGTEYEKYDSDTHRYDNLSKWSSNIILNGKVEKCFIEGYAFGAVGRVFQIAENTGLLKYKLWKDNIPFGVFAPSEIKKHASGKGNSNKEKLYECFLEETKIDIRKILDIPNEKVWNPVSDIVDAYYIAKLGFHKTVDNDNEK